MILPVYGYGHPLLRKISEEIKPDYLGLNQLIADMFETMYASAGVGLAAPQIGLNIRLFVIDAEPYKDKVGDPGIPLKHVFINPTILEESGEPWMFEEGCLSIPDIREDVERQPLVKLRFMNEQFEVTEKYFDGMMARIIQHEYDHLEGVMFVDHVSNLRKMLLKKRLNDIVTGRVNPGYRMKYATPKR
jgi:peptide deformylase